MAAAALRTSASLGPAPAAPVATSAQRTSAAPTSVGALNSVASPALSLAPSAGREEKPKSWWERGTKWLGEAIDFTENLGWELAERFVPDLVPILRRGPEGILEWMKEKASAALEAVFNGLMAPVRAYMGAGRRLAAHFAPLVAWIQDAAGKIAQNDCSPLREAAEKIEQVAMRLITPIVEFVQPIIARIESFFKGLWEKFGAPVWEWIKNFAGEQWEQIKQVASWIWDKTAWIRERVARAWTWLKNKIGIGEGPEGQNGILQWVQGKLGAAWDWLKAKLEPFKKELTVAAAVIGGIVLLLSPAGPVVIAGAAVVGIVEGIRWIKANWGKGDAIVRARVYLEKVLIPKLQAAIGKVTGSVASMAGSLNGALGNLAAGMGRMVGAAAASFLRFALSAVQWIADQVGEIARWASEKLVVLSGWLTKAFAFLKPYLQRMLDFMGRIGRLVVDIWGLPVLLAEKLWDLIPACIRDPFVDFVIPIILRQIEIFKELVRDDDAWQKTKKDVSVLIRLVFKDHDLMGAVKATFHLVLRVFKVPVELAKEVARKALAAWSVVVKKPIAFIKNAVRSLGVGFQLLWKNITGHLAYGVEGWLFGELADKGIRPPASWKNPTDVFGFVLDVLGLSMNHIFELLKKRFDPAKIEKLKVWYGRISRAVAWIREAIDTSKSPAENAKGLWERAKEFGKSVLEGVIEWIAGRVAKELAILATAAAASGGLSEIVDIVRRIYTAIVSAVRWAEKILRMVSEALDTVLEIASGAIDAAGEKFEKVMHRGMPIVIGFLADQVGLGGIGEKMRELVDKLREKVDEAILWLIDKIKAGIESIIAAIKGAAGALLQWWKKRKKIETGDEPHDLWFDGDEDTAELWVKSSATRLESFLDGANNDPAYKDKKDVLAALAKLPDKVRQAKRALRAAKESEKDEKRGELEAVFDEVGVLLDKLFATSDVGTRNSPIELNWPKPASANYRPLFLHYSPTKQDPWLVSGRSKEKGYEQAKQYRPHGDHVVASTKFPDPPKDLEQALVGIDSRYQIPRSEVGPLKPNETGDDEDKRANSAEVRRRLQKYNWDGTDGKADADIDHITELQYSGDDVFKNLWPLEASINRSGGSQLSRMPVVVGGQEVTISWLKQAQEQVNKKSKKQRYYFDIVSTKG